MQIAERGWCVSVCVSGGVRVGGGQKSILLHRLCSGFNCKVQKLKWLRDMIVLEKTGVSGRWRRDDGQGAEG